jgi:PAS domain S-box-containing protein
LITVTTGSASMLKPAAPGKSVIGAEALQTAIFNSVNFSKIATDANGVIQIFNIGAERMLGYLAEEVLNKLTPAEISDPQESIARAQVLSAELKTAIAPGFEALIFKASRGIEDIYELTYIRKDGSRFPAVVSVTALRDADGAIIGYLLIGTDNTARKKAEAELRKSNERIAIASESAGIGTWEFDVRSNAATWDNGMYKIYDVQREADADLYALWVQCMHPQDRERAERELAAAMRGESEFDTEFRLVRRDGEIRYLKAAARSARSADGGVIRLTGVNVDITARKRIEAEQTLLAQRLSDHQFYTRSLFESNIDALMTTDACGVITDVNNQMEVLTGCTRDELIGALFKTLFTDPDRAEAGSRLALGKGKVTEYELTARDRNGKETVVSYNATTLYDRERRLQGVFAAVRDVTERKQYERSLREATSKAEQANSAKSEFLANMSHEIRTPLNAVIGLGYLLEHTTLSEDQRQLLAKIQFGGRALLGVVNNVLDLSKIEAGEMSLEDEAFDLPELVRDLGLMLAPQAAAKGIELVVGSAPTLPRMVRGDASRLRQILTNLLGNSIKFTEAGQVELKVFATESSADRIRLRCTVQDTGIGIEPAALNDLFTPFTQADASTTRRFGGTGLGLSIARRFIELMGGEIGVTSSVGVGSTFWIEMPLRVAHEVDATASKRGLRILIADSSADAPDRLAAMTRALGWSPKIAKNGEQLLAIMMNTQPGAWPDVLLLELHLHDMDAHQLIARLQKESARGNLPPVIVVSDRAQSYVDHNQHMRTSDVLLVRPLTSSALFNAVNAIVSKRPDSLERVLQSTNFDELNAQWLNGVRVLVVDDSDINLEVAQRILEQQGATVVSCSDGLAALDHVRSRYRELDVVLMDVQMPVLDGNETTRRIRAEPHLRALPIVALTAGALVVERQRALDAGMNDVISKPFDPQALIRKVRQLVEKLRGEPIPIVLRDAQSIQNGLDQSNFIPSIDAGIVQQMFGDDLVLFKSLLVRLLREYADLTLPICISPNDEIMRGQLVRRTHKLKGSAGIIGAAGIARLAGAAHNALQQGREVGVVEGLLLRLASALSTLGEETKLYLKRQPAGPVTDVAVANHPDAATPQLDALFALLESGNLAALDKFKGLSQPLSELLGPSRFGYLCTAVDNLDFELGAQLLREAMLPVTSISPPAQRVLAQ